MNTSIRSSKIFALALASLLGALGSAKASVINVTVDSSGALRNGVGVATKDEYGLGNNSPDSNLTFLNAEIGLYNAALSPDLPIAVAPVGANIESLGGSSTYTTIGGWDYLVIHYGAGQAEFADAPVWVPTVIVPAGVPVYYTAAEVAAWNALPKNKHKQISTSTVKTPGAAGYTIAGHFTETNWEKSSGGWWQAYYIGGLAGVLFTVPIPGPTYGDLIYNGKPVGGFSSARYFNEHIVHTDGGDPHSVPEGGNMVALLGLGLVVMAFSARRIRSVKR